MTISPALRWAMPGGIAMVLALGAFAHHNTPFGFAALTAMVACAVVCLDKLFPDSRER